MILTKPEKREKLLATLVRKIIIEGDDYDQVRREVTAYAKENDIRIDWVRMADEDYLEHLEW